MFDPCLNQEIKVLLAPMEGVVDPIMRDVITRIGGVDLCVTEFIRVTDRLLPEHEFFKYAPELKQSSRTRAGTKVLLQLLGGQPQPIAENAARAAALGACGIDLNFGCPAKTVNRHDGGATLLKNPNRVFDVVKAVRRAVPAHLPVTAKVRLGFSDKTQSLEIAMAAEEAGSHWLTVHARTRDEGYTPPAHWEFISPIRERLKIPVIANGDIWSLADYRRCRDVTGCEVVMLGRGLIARPDLARQIQGYVKDQLQDELPAPIQKQNTDPPQSLSGTVKPMGWHELRQWLSEFSTASLTRSEKYAVARSKQWSKCLARNFQEAAVHFENIKRLENLEPMLQQLQLV